MSGSAPSSVPTWATDAGATIEPSAGKKAAGWVVSERPPARWMNWWKNLVYQWIYYYGSKDTAGGVVGLHDTNKSVTFTAASGTAITVTGQGAGAGVSGTGGATNGSIGIQGTSSATNGIGGKFTGTGTGNAVELVKGSGATNALIADGEIDLSSAAYPAATAARNDVLCPSNIPKAWARITGGGAGAPTLVDGFNIASLTRIDDYTIQVTFAQAMANANYAIFPNSQSAFASYGTIVAGSFYLASYDLAGAPLTTSGRDFTVFIFGRQ